MPSRRRLLRTCATAIPLGVAGCLGTGGDSPDGTGTSSDTASPDEATETTPTTRTPPPTTASSLPEAREVEPAGVSDRGVPRIPTIESDTYEPFRGFVVGEMPESPGAHYETPHVWVWNLTGESATIAVVVTTGGDELLRVEAEFPAGAPLAVAFSDRGTYEVRVQFGDREKTVTVDPDRFWCNASVTDVMVRPDSIESGTITTDMACTTTPGGS